jgi:trans-aconitate methyltransferase
LSNITEQDIIKVFEPIGLRKQGQQYLEYHGKRLAYAMNTISDYKQRAPVKKLLDIGPHHLTRCIIEFFPDIEVSTLGWRFQHTERIIPAALYKEHIQYDLNDAGVTAIQSGQAPFDLIVFSETIEHLYTSPLTVLNELKKLLSPAGAVLIQTPNAATLKSRWALLCGRNPYELIREEKTNPGHFREYTLDELTRYATQTGFKVERAEYCDYWRHPHPIVRTIESAVPSFRQGISLLIRNA